MTTKWPAGETSRSNPPESCNDTVLLFFHFLIKFGTPHGIRREQARCSSVDRNNIGTKTRQDNFITFLLNTLVTDLAPQVAKANRGGPGTIK